MGVCEGMMGGFFGCCAASWRGSPGRVAVWGGGRSRKGGPVAVRLRKRVGGVGRANGGSGGFNGIRSSRARCQGILSRAGAIYGKIFNYEEV